MGDAGEKGAGQGTVRVDELQAFVQDAFDAIPQSTVRARCEEFEDRLAVCIEQEGGTVSRVMLRRYRARVKTAKKGAAGEEGDDGA